MFCSRCYKKFEGTGIYCRSCIILRDKERELEASKKGSHDTFYRLVSRFVAHWIDLLILISPQYLAACGIYLIANNWEQATLQKMHEFHFKNYLSLLAPAEWITRASILSSIGVTAMIVSILYFSVCESSSWRGSIGKLLLGLIVVKKNGERLEFFDAVKRNISRRITLILAGIVGVFLVVEGSFCPSEGPFSIKLLFVTLIVNLLLSPAVYLPILLEIKSQRGLHDILAGTIVLSEPDISESAASKLRLAVATISAGAASFYLYNFFSEF